MAISFSLLAATLVSTADQTTPYTGNTGTCAAGDLLIAFASVTGVSSGGSLSGGGLTWNSFGTGLKGTTDSTVAFWAYSASAVSITPSFQPGGSATGLLLTVVRVAGTTATAGSNGFAQTFATNTGTTANPSVTFGTATNTNNGILLFASNTTNSSTQFTAPTGFTELDEQTYATPSNAIEIAYRTSGGTASTYTWTNANTTAWKVYGIEITAAGVGPTSNLDPLGMQGFFGI